MSEIAIDIVPCVDDISHIVILAGNDLPLSCHHILTVYRMLAG